ncbi:MAG: putative secreted protein, partial [Planctomycetota bacterium]
MTELLAKAEASRKKVTEKFQPDLDKILEVAQRDRLKQIQIQADGSRAYQNADVVAALKISKEQQDKLAAISKEFGDKARELFPRGGAGGGERTNFEEMQKKMTELNAARDKQLAEVLTADQKSAFEKLKGK